MRILPYAPALSLLLLAGSCTFAPPEPPKSQLQIRQFQTRTYDSMETKRIMKSVLNVLQDEGYTVKNVSLDLGFLTATKEVDLDRGSMNGVALFFGTMSNACGGNSNYTYNKSEIIEATINVSDFGDQVKIRANFASKVLDNRGGVVRIRPIENGAFYQDFFSKVDKGLFLEKENL